VKIPWERRGGRQRKEGEKVGSWEGRGKKVKRWEVGKAEKIEGEKLGR
jgi:hypothetical protein